MPSTKRAKEKKPRHRDLSKLSSIMAFHRRPEGVAEQAPSEPLAREQTAPMGTNWRVTPANHNRRPEDFANERAVEYVPSVPAIETAMATVEMKYRLEPMMRRQDDEGWELRRSSREVHGIPVAGDILHGVHVDDDGKEHKVITRIGRLRFSDGTQTERGYKLSFGKVVEAQIVLPVGCMLGCREKSTRDKGAVQDPVELACTHDYFAGKNEPPGLFDAQSAGRVKSKSRASRTGPRTKAEAKQWLAEAVANTPVMPPVTKCPDGFPAGPKNLAHLFPGLVKVATGKGGSPGWEGIASEFEERNEWHFVLQGMKDEHVELLTRTAKAKSLQEIGEIRGYTGKYAIEAGRRLLVAANDNYLEAKKLATEARAA
ncbi:hypothetical protein ASE37_18885 [Rhizobium sp. Root268]|nr:hypothetical protein ASC86_18385 [Rhizobium sp. Root1212]KRD21589.1 hypothetical protein ASE37_18885 [Rhizobium sp. Root268]